MPFEIVYSDHAVQQLKKLRAFDRKAVVDEIDQVLAVNPMLESRAKIKLLRQPAPAQYRLRVGDFRVFYDAAEATVTILQILAKQDTDAYLKGTHDNPANNGSPDSDRDGT